MLKTSARLLRLLSLLQARRDWTGPELAARLGVSPRTLRRDMDKLRSLGYPVDATPGTAGGYRLGAGAMLPPLLLDDEEAVAVAIGLRTAAGGTITGIEEASVRALVKLEQVLPGRLRHRVSALHSVTVPLPGAGPPVDPVVLTVIATAARDRLRIGFRYTSHDGTQGGRAAEPHQLVHTGRRWYLLAWDLARGDWRTFRADRITSPQITGPRFTPRDPPGGDPAAYVSRSVSTTPYRYQARIRLHVPASAVAERLPPPSATSKPTANTPASSTPAPNHLTCSPSTWPSSVPSSRSSTHPNSPSTFSPWPAGSPARPATDSQQTLCTAVRG